MEEIDDDASNVFRLKLPASVFARNVTAKFGIHRSGHDIAYLDAIVSHFLHQGFAESIQTKLRRVIGSHFGVRVCTRQRRDVDDIAATTLLHLRNNFMAAIENAK